MLPPERRLGRVMQLIEDRKYFTLYAGRQTGKTTCAKALVRHYNAGQARAAIWIDIQTAREEPVPERAFRTILDCMNVALRRTFPDLEPFDIPKLLEIPGMAIFHALSSLASRVSRPLVVFFDEADGLVGEAMVSFLTQLRSGYIDRDRTRLPESIILVGQRQVRDFVISAEEGRQVTWLGTSSPFNITAEAVTLDSFSEEEVAELLTQHTQATGQVFEPEAVALVYGLTLGHPWLVNALAAQITDWDVRDRSTPITVNHVESARETIVLERRSHIDSLVARLREPRVRRILDPMIAGLSTAPDTLDDDFAYVKGLGLIAERGGVYRIANPIYQEVIPRALTLIRQRQIHHEPSWYVRADRSLDMEKLLKAWQVFWQEDGHLAAEGFSYLESGPHLMLMAFLQRIVNGGGRIEREYALGRGALDLMIFWGPKGQERHVVEVKLRRDTETEQRALEQLCRYLDSTSMAEGYLVLFDLRKGRAWDEKLTWARTQYSGRSLTIVGC